MAEEASAGGAEDAVMRIWSLVAGRVKRIATNRNRTDQTYMKAYLLFAVAALAEIAGCFAFWAWWRLDKPAWWLAPGMVSLALFAAVLALVPSEAAGRTYAAYGGIYIVASILWLWLVEGRLPDRWDVTGGLVCLAGATLILFGPRS